jgi:hypothetical protein
MRKAGSLPTSSRHAREGGHPVIAGVSDRVEEPRRTGSSAFADDDGLADDGGGETKKGRDRSRPFVLLRLTQFEARFGGGEAGHDLIRAS